MRCRLDNFQFADYRITDALRRGQLMDAGGKHMVEVAKIFKQASR